MCSRSLADRLPGRFPARRLAAPAALMLVLALGVTSAQSQRAAPPGTRRPPEARRAPERAPADPVVARVEGEAIRLSELEQRRQRNMEAYRRQTGQSVPAGYETFFLRTALEEAVRERLLQLDARAQGRQASLASAESLLKTDPFFRAGGRFDAAKFAAYKEQNPQGFQEVRDHARKFLTFQRHAQSLERRVTPDAAALDALWRTRASKVSLRYALVSDLHFDGRHDPTDDELRAFYARQKDALTRPAQVTLSLAVLPWAPPGGEAALSDSARAAVRDRARELLSRIAAGEAFDSVAFAAGARVSPLAWQPGQEGGPFAAEPAWGESALASPAGRVLPEPIATLEGAALVRVDRVEPASVPPLARVANDLRARFRAERMAEEERAEAQRLFEAEPDSFATAAWQVRWAIVDTAGVRAPEPSDKELRAWFEGHQAEFARLDPGGTGVVTPGLEAVRGLVEARWRQERRMRQAREVADKLATAWGRGKDGSRASGVTLGGPAWIVEGGALPNGLDPA